MSETAAVHLSASARMVAEALAEDKQFTVTALANLARVSKSSVAKALALLERSGAAIRAVREHDGIREADLWSCGPALGALLAPATAAATDYGHADIAATATKTAVGMPSSSARAGGDPAGDLDGRTPAAIVPDQVAAERLVPPSVPTAGVGAASGVEPSRVPASASPADSVAAAGVATNTPCTPGESPAAGRVGRLAAGELASMVAALMAAHPDVEYTPLMLSHMLNGRSSGAISNVLAKMVQSGAAVRTSDKPRRYRQAAV